jgi:hypothetical protein
MTDILYLIECKGKEIDTFHKFLINSKFKSTLIETNGNYFLIDLVRGHFNIHKKESARRIILNMKVEDINISKIGIAGIKNMIKNTVPGEETLSKILKELKSINKKLGKFK